MGGDFNAQLGAHEVHAQHAVVGPRALGRRTDHGDRLIEFAITWNLVVANTFEPCMSPNGLKNDPAFPPPSSFSFCANAVPGVDPESSDRCSLWTHERPNGNKVQLDYWLVPLKLQQRCHECRV